MSAAKILTLAGAIALLSTAAVAADFPPPMPPQVAPADASGWYLRGYLGMSNQFFNGLSHPSFTSVPQFAWSDKGGFDSAPFFGGGVGYIWNNWLRFDATGEWRGKASFHALDHFDNGGTLNTNDYTGSKTEWVGLFNAYLDLGTWWRITPYIGAGVGVANIRIEHFRDTNAIGGGVNWADSRNKTNLAWALHAGASYKVTNNFAVDLSYRYLNMGNGQTGTLINLDPTLPSPNPLAPMTFRNIQSHDLMLGMRWMLQQEPVYQPPLVRKG